MQTQARDYSAIRVPSHEEVPEVSSYFHLRFLKQSRITFVSQEDGNYRLCVLRCGRIDCHGSGSQLHFAPGSGCDSIRKAKTLCNLPSHSLALGGATKGCSAP